MRLGVVICPSCKNAKGIDLSKKTTRCPRCGRLLHVQNLKIVYESDSPEAVRKAIGFINAKTDGKSITFEKI